MLHALPYLAIVHVRIFGHVFALDIYTIKTGWLALLPVKRPSMSQAPLLLVFSPFVKCPLQLYVVHMLN